MNTYLSTINRNFNELKVRLNNDLINAANHGKLNEVQELSKLAFKLNLIEDILQKDANISKGNEVQKRGKKRGRKPKNIELVSGNEIDLSLLNEKQSIVPLSSDMTNKKPTAVSLLGETHVVNSFRSLTEAVCRELYKMDSNKFISLEHNLQVNGDKHKYFSMKQESTMTDPVIIGSGVRSIYIDVAKLAINNLFFLKKVVKEMGVNPDDVKVSLDTTYKRKPREKKAKK